MRASINRVGRLALMPENENEEFAAACWFGKACEETPTVVLSVEMKGLQLGPQPCYLAAIKKEGEDDGN